MKTLTSKTGTRLCLITSSILIVLGIVIPFIPSSEGIAVSEIGSMLYAGILAAIVVVFFVQSIKELLNKGQMSFDFFYLFSLILLFIPILINARHSLPCINKVLIKLPTACFSALFVYLWKLLGMKINKWFSK